MGEPRQDRETPSADPRYLRISDRISLRYQESGAGPPLVLLHTIRTQLEYFRALVPLLAKKFTVYAVDLPGHGSSSVDTAAQYDEPYLRKGVIDFLMALNLHQVTLVGESIGAVIALTVASDIPDHIKAVYAFNPYDYETRYGDGLRRGNWFANLIIGSLQFPVVGAIGASLANSWIIGKIMAGGYADPRKRPGRHPSGTLQPSITRQPVGCSDGFHRRPTERGPSAWIGGVSWPRASCWPLLSALWVCSPL